MLVIDAHTYDTTLCGSRVLKVALDISMFGHLVLDDVHFIKVLSCLGFY